MTGTSETRSVLTGGRKKFYDLLKVDDFIKKLFDGNK